MLRGRRQIKIKPVGLNWDFWYQTEIVCNKDTKTTEEEMGTERGHLLFRTKI